jgi:hypothetical protein
MVAGAAQHSARRSIGDAPLRNSARDAALSPFRACAVCGVRCIGWQHEPSCIPRAVWDVTYPWFGGVA